MAEYSEQGVVPLPREVNGVAGPTQAGEPIIFGLDPEAVLLVRLADPRSGLTLSGELAPGLVVRPEQEPPGESGPPPAVAPKRPRRPAHNKARLDDAERAAKQQAEFLAAEQAGKPRPRERYHENLAATREAALAGMVLGELVTVPRPLGRIQKARGAAAYFAPAAEQAAAATGRRAPATRKAPKQPRATAEKVETTAPAPSAKARQEAQSGATHQIYLDQIGKISLLRAEQEVELGEAIQAGLAAARKLTAGDFHPDNQKELEEAVRRGAAAKTSMVEANLRLVVKIAKFYTSQRVPLEDLIQEGNIGLMRAAEKFDPTKGYKFSSYATFAIRQAMLRGLQELGRSIHLPIYKLAAIEAVHRVRRTLRTSLNREPTDKEVADAADLTIDDYAELMSYAAPVQSLERPLVDGNTGTLGDMISDKPAVAPDTAHMAKRGEQAAATLLRLIELSVAGIKNRERAEREMLIMRLRFGLEDGKEWTPAEIAVHIGFSETTVYNICGYRLTAMKQAAAEQGLYV